MPPKIPNYFMILGPQDGAGNLQYWEFLTREWNSEHIEATRFDRDILTSPIPEGTVGIMEFSEEDEPVRFFQVLDLPPADLLLTI